jgi:hypothetical protein
VGLPILAIRDSHAASCDGTHLDHAGRTYWKDEAATIPPQFKELYRLAKSTPALLAVTYYAAVLAVAIVAVWLRTWWPSLA